MAKSLLIKLSPNIIADFEASFSTQQEERAYIYKNITEKINQAVGEVFQKRTCQISTIQDGKKIQKASTLDEINFEKTEIPTNTQWVTKDIAGKLESYEYLVGTALMDKITNYCKLFYITNKIFNESIISDSKEALVQLQGTNKATPQEIKIKQEQIIFLEKQIKNAISEDCLEGYIYLLISAPMIQKINQKEKEILDKEFAELNKPKESPTRK